MNILPEIPGRTIVINATNVGSKLNGIGIYALSLLRAFSVMENQLHFIVYLNKSCRAHIQGINFPANFTLKWVSPRLSPDHGFKGHVLRLLFANLLSLGHPKTLIFAASQSEACFFRANQVITIHDVIPLLFREFHKKQYYYFRYFLKPVLRRAKYAITPSRHSRGLIREFYQVSADKVHVISNGIQEIYQIGIKSCMFEKDNFILYTGRISPMKNIAGIFKAFARISQKIPHKLVIVGEEKTEIEKEIRAGRLLREDIENERIEFKGFLPDKEMKELMKRASMLIFPSLYEGFGLPPLEAMACGCPVVASNAASLPEVCGSAVYYVNPYSVESIAEGMYLVLTNRRLKNYLIRKGFSRAKLFSWQTSAREHLQVLRNALGFSHVPLSIPLPFHFPAKNLEEQ